MLPPALPHRSPQRPQKQKYRQQSRKGPAAHRQCQQKEGGNLPPGQPEKTAPDAKGKRKQLGQHPNSAAGTQPEGIAAKAHKKGKKRTGFRCFSSLPEHQIHTCRHSQPITDSNQIGGHRTAPQCPGQCQNRGNRWKGKIILIVKYRKFQPWVLFAILDGHAALQPVFRLKQVTVIGILGQQCSPCQRMEQQNCKGKQCQRSGQRSPIRPGK